MSHDAAGQMLCLCVQERLQLPQGQIGQPSSPILAFQIELYAVSRGQRCGFLPLRTKEGKGDVVEELPEGDVSIWGLGIAGVRLPYQLVAFGFRLTPAHLEIDAQRGVLSGASVAIEQDPHLPSAVFSYLQTAFLMTLSMHVCPFRASTAVIQVRSDHSIIP